MTSVGDRHVTALLAMTKSSERNSRQLIVSLFGVRRRQRSCACRCRCACRLRCAVCGGCRCIRRFSAGCGSCRCIILRRCGFRRRCRGFLFCRGLRCSRCCGILFCSGLCRGRCGILRFLVRFRSCCRLCRRCSRLLSGRRRCGYRHVLVVERQDDLLLVVVRDCFQRGLRFGRGGRVFCLILLCAACRKQQRRRQKDH